MRFCVHPILFTINNSSVLLAVSFCLGCVGVGASSNGGDAEVSTQEEEAYAAAVAVTELEKKLDAAILDENFSLCMVIDPELVRYICHELSTSARSLTHSNHTYKYAQYKAHLHT